MEHQVDPALFRRAVQVDLIGAGGNGSQMLTGLARLHLALLSLGHPEGLHVTAWDDDTVSEANVGRQLFSPSDVGCNKADVLVTRLNAYYGLDWKANPYRWDKQTVSYGHRPDLAVSCVDSKAARREMHHLFSARQGAPRYWLDLGNRANDAQLVLGEPDFYRRGAQRNAYRLPCVTELYPEILDAESGEDDTTPSCSLAEALERQSLFVNQAVVTFALDLLFRMFRYGKVDFHGAFINLASARVSPLAIDPAVWKRINPGLKGKIRKKPLLSVVKNAA